MNKTQPTPEEITAVVSEQPDLYQPTVQPLDAVQDNGYFPIEVDAEDKELAAPSLAKLATPSSDRNWLQRFKVAAKTAVSNILNGQMTHNVALGNKRITFGKNKEEIEFGRRMASEAKRQIEEVMDGTEELTAEEAETWAAALGGGSVSMVDFAANLALLRGLGAGSVGAQLGAGWLAGRAGYEEGTMSDIDKYIAETGDKELKNYKGDKKAFAVNVASGAIQGSIEAATSGLGRYLINNPLTKKVLGKTGNDAIRKLASTAVGRTLAAGANESVNNAFEEWTQALTGNIAEIVKGNEEFSMDNILNGAGQAAGVGALLGWVATPVMQEYGRRKTRDWISDKLRKASEEKGIPLTETEIKDAANDLVGIIESKGVQKVSENYEKINQLAGAESDLAQTLTKVFEDLVNQDQIKFRQATPDEIRQAGLDWANYMQATALLDSLDREIPISAHPLFNAVAEADRIFLEGRDPGTGDLLPLDINNAQVRELANQIEDYIEQNRETRQAEEASKLAALREADMRARQETIQELERAAIAELEKEQAANNQERITELQQQITELQHQMDLLREERSKYIQERAAQGRISIGRAKAQTAPDNKALTKKAIRSGNLDIIKQILQDNGFKTRDLSGTQTKQMAQLNWEMFAGKDLGTTKSKYDQNVAMKAIEQNVVSGDAVLLRAGYTQGQIDQMDDKTWNRALQAAYQEETEALKSVQPQLTPEQAAEIPDDMLYQDLAAENARLDDMYPAYTGETINIDGKERTVYNSNGERIAQSEPALRNFYKWFGNSKVVDEQGRPLVVYHGTSAEFDTFLQDKVNNTSEGYGFYFIDNESVAQGFGNTMPVYLSLQNPQYAYNRIFLAWDYEGDLDIDEANNEMVKDAIQSVKTELESKGYEFYPQVQSELFDNITGESQVQEVLDGLLYMKGYLVKDFDSETFINDVRTAEINAFGIDGYISKNYAGGSGRVYVAFKPNQIKSVNNRGTFDIANPNIYYQSELPEMLMHYQPGYVSLPVPEMIGGKLDVDTYRGTGESGARWGDGNYILADMELDKRYYFDEWNKVQITYEGKPAKEWYSNEAAYNFLRRLEAKYLKNPRKLGEAVEQLKQEHEALIKTFTKELSENERAIKRLYKSVPVDAAGPLKEFETAITNEYKSRLAETEVYTKAIDEMNKARANLPGTAFSVGLRFLEAVRVKLTTEDTLKRAKDTLDFINNLDLSKLEAKNTASLYRVEVPEAEFLLDMQLPFDKQSERVRAAIIAIGRELGANLTSRHTNYPTMDKEFIAKEVFGLSDKQYTTMDYFDKDYINSNIQQYFSYLHKHGQLYAVQEAQDFIEYIDRLIEKYAKAEDKKYAAKNRAKVKKIKDFIAGIKYPSHYVRDEVIENAHVHENFFNIFPKGDRFGRWVMLDREFGTTMRVYLSEGFDAADAYVERFVKDKPFYDRLKKIWNKAKEWIEEGKIGKIITLPRDINGEEIQDKLAQRLDGSYIAARKKLYEYGILGNTYYGGRDGRGFVIFSGEDAPVQEKIFQDQPQAKLIATHNMSKEGLERALDLGGLMMPSMAITKFTDGPFTGYGDISFIGDAILANPTRTTDAYDRDAWTPMVNNIVHQFTEGGVERLKALVEEAKQKNPRDTNSYSVYRMNIEKGMSDDPRSNTMAVELFSILHDIPREQARQNITYNWGEEKTEMHKQYLEWYNDKLLVETKAFIYEGYTPSGKIRLKPLTLDNLVAALKKQDRFGRMTGDFFTPSDIIKMNLVRFKNVGEIRDAQGRLVSRDEAHEAYKEIGSDFYNLASELNKHNVKENDYTSSDQRLAWALILEKGTLEERLAKQNLKNDAESVKKVKKFIKDVKNIKVPYFEVKPRRAVKFYEFSGVILPKGESYDNLAARLEEEGVLNIYRATTPEEKTAALKDLTEKRPWTLLQNKKTSKSTTGLGTEHRGGYDPMTKAIIFNKTSDLTTLFHESAHYWFDRNLRYYRTGLASPEWKKKWEDVMNELGATPNARGTIPVSAIRSASEKFARSMEAYLREGKYESAAIQWAHQDYANMVKRVYRNIWSTYWGLDDLSPAVKQWFDMFGLKTDDATTAFAEEDKIETDEQMVGAVVAEDATKPDVDAETKTIVADAGAQVVENPATQEIAVVPADPFETGKKARSKLPRSAEAATGVSMDDIIYNRRSMSDAFKAAQQLVNTDPVRAWEILKGGQEMVDGLYAGDIYRALVAKYQAENNPMMLKNVVQAFAGAARRAGRSVKAFDLESPRISFEKTINSLDKIFDTKKNDKRIEKVKNELKEFLHDPSALRVGWEEFKNIVGCK